MKIHKSLAARIALRFSLVVTFLMLFFGLTLVLLLRKNIRSRENVQLITAAGKIEELAAKGIDLAQAGQQDLQDIPYYLTFIVYRSDTGKVIITNDPFLPQLPLSGGKSKRYTKKGYFTDGDLNILYFAEKIPQSDNLVVQTVLNMDQDTAEQLLGFIPQTVILLFLPLLLISYGVTFLIACKALLPVAEMTSSARKISSTSMVNRLPVSTRGDELDTLAETFNALFVQLKVDFDRERSFTSDVSHELKTPIAVILGQANLLRRWGKNDPVQLDKSIAALITEAHSMEAVVSNLLQLTRLENGTVKPLFQKVMLKDLFCRLEGDTSVWSPDTHFLFDGVQTGAAVRCDPELFYQVCTIIVSNSIKFTGNNTVIKISADDIDGKTVISFTDNGPGIKDEVLPHVFERFYRGDPSHNRSAGGSGLGLSIAREIVSVSGGSISARSLPVPEHGAVLAVILPSA